MADIRKREGKKGTTYQVRFPDASKKSGYSYATFSTLKAARAFTEDSRQRGQPTSVATTITTVPQAVDKWLEICVTEGTENHEPITRYTQKTYQFRAEIMKRYPWDKPLQALQPVDIRAFKAWLLAHCKGRHQAMKVLSSFHTVMQEMALRGIIANNVVSGISIKMDARYKQKIVPPSEQEVIQLLAAADRLANSKNRQTARTWERYRPILYLAADTGARPQEYLALAHTNVFDKEIKIDRAIERGGYKISVTKTEAGWRWLDISPETHDMITHYIKHYTIPNNHDLAFPTSSGRWLMVDGWRSRGFYKACEEAGLMKMVEEDGVMVEKPKYSPYDLRHFYASMLIEKRLNLKRIQTLLGHENITTTLNTYGHLIDRVEAAKEAPSGLLGMLGQPACGKNVASEG